MFQNYLKITFRNLWKNRQYSIINVLGLSIGIAAVVLILIYLRFEWSYDRFHENVDDIYRIAVESNWEGRIDKFHLFLAPVGPALKKDFPQVKEFTRIRKQVGGYFSSEDVFHKIDKIHYVDSSFFNMFSFKILTGDPKQPLEAPYSIVLTRSKAMSLWGTEDVVGKILQSDNRKFYTVTALVEDPPINSTIDFDALISFNTLYQDPNMFMGWNGGQQYTTYIQLLESADKNNFESQIEGFIDNYIKTNQISFLLSLEPFKQIHLFYEPGFLFLRILQFGAVALLILLMGSANFINITLAQSIKRTKEACVRKVIGAGRAQLIFQFLVESFITTILASIIGVSLIEFVFSGYSQILGQDIPRSALFSPHFLVSIFIITGLVGIIAGAIPAYYMASLAPAGIMKNSFLSGHRKGRFRSILLFLQFFISVLLIFSTLIIYQQQVYMKNKVLGFNKDNILVIDLLTEDLRASNQLIRNAVNNLPFVHHASLNSQIPYDGLDANGYLPEGFSDYKPFHVIHTDEDFLKTFDISLVEGRPFLSDMKTDKNACLINQSLADQLGWKNPVGMTIERNEKFNVIGVVRDFHFATMHEKIEPLIIINTNYKGYLNRLALKIDSNAISSGEAIRQIRNVISEIVPSSPFDYWFLDDVFDSLYRKEEALSRMFVYSTSLAIFIAFLGLYGLVSIETEFRTKEIGIRKVLGSSILGIINSISRGIFRPVFWAVFFAWPVAWCVADKWLQNFPYRIGLSIWPFLVSGLTMVCIAIITVYCHSFKAAALNPVDSLRSE